MKSLILILCLFLLVNVSWQISEKCIESSTNLKEAEEECTNQEYSSYTECMRRNRAKRQLDCEQEECDDCETNVQSSSNCEDCNCDYCSYHECNTNCNQCCNSQPPPCSSNHCCHKTCNNQCRSYDCRRRCKKTCQEKISTIASPSASNVGITTNTSVQSLHNITTVINLHNIINNTNIIDMPVQVNNTNINNITIQTPNIELPSHKIAILPSMPNSPLMPIPMPMPMPIPNSPLMPMPMPIPNSPLMQMPMPIPNSPLMPMPMPVPQHIPQPNMMGYNIPPGLPIVPQPSCCKIIEPRQCTPTTTFPFQRCFHIRRQHCGALCTSNIMHAQPHQICDQEAGAQASCQQQVTYIPQPQPRCFASSSWPYVNCHLQNYATANCEGCYGGGYKDQRQCSNTCFDRGFDGGPHMRPEPFYQSPYGLGNAGNMDYNTMNLFGGPGAFMGVPSDHQFGIVRETGLNKRDSIANDRIERVHEPIGRGYKSFEDLEHTFTKEENLNNSKEKHNDNDSGEDRFENN